MFKVNIMSFNVQSFNCIHKKLQCFLQFLKEHKVEIIFFQEAYKGTIPKELYQIYETFVHYPEKGLAIFSKYPIKTYEFKPFDYKKYDYKKFDNKGYIYANINGVDFYNVHLDHISEITRLSQITELLVFEKTKRLPDNICKDIYILGDFNSLNVNDYTEGKWKYMLQNETEYTHPESLVYNLISQFYKDSYNGAKNPVTSHFGRRVDYIFTNSARNNSFIDNTIKLSDHYPIYMQIEMDNR